MVHEGARVVTGCRSPRILTKALPRLIAHVLENIGAGRLRVYAADTWHGAPTRPCGGMNNRPSHGGMHDDMFIWYAG